MKVFINLLTLAMIGSLTAAAWAIPANPKPVRVTQPDGSIISLHIHGDEHHHWLTDATTGRRVRQDADGYYVEAPVSADQMDLKPMRTRRHELTTPPRTLTRQGDCNYLAILVDFPDMKMTYTQKDFDHWLNVDGYYGTGSVRQYWIDNSRGKFSPKFTVVGPYRMSNRTSFYGAPDQVGNPDADPRSMVREAVLATKADHPELDFSQFDNDGDGVMDNCYVIYAGYSQASSAVDNDIWPHSWKMEDQSLVIDGTVVYEYSCSQELVGGDRSVKRMDGIGTFTHEFGHILGLDDLYDTDDYNNGIGVHPGNYSLYAHGSYNNNSRTPAGLWAFERNQMGWLEEGEGLIRLEGNMDVELQPMTEGGSAAFIDCQPGLEDGKEWIMMENRQQQGWDKYIPGHGLLIYHYDYTVEAQSKYWSVNGPNNYAKHPCLYIKAADGADSDTNREADTWPGLTGADTFTDDTHPSARNWHGDATHTPLKNIRESEDGRVAFQVGEGEETWNVIRALPPTQLRAITATLRGQICLDEPQPECGLVWKSGRDAIPSVGSISLSTGSVVLTPDDEGYVQYDVTDLKPGTWYTLRPYYRTSDGTVEYGTALTFQTDYATAEAPFVEFFAEDYNPETDQPNTWEIVDHNGDGTVWQLSEGDGALFYEFDYWNDADDWLMSRRQWHIPEHGILTFMRGVMNISTVESLEVYVSTGERRVEDFVLQKQFSMADNFGSLVYEEVDLSAYAGQDVYVAFRCTSEKLQDALWLFMVSLTRKLDTPQITYFGATDATGEQLRAEWEPVDGATKYYMWFGRETTEPFTDVIFVPTSAWQSHTANVSLSAGGLTFTGNGEAVLQPYSGGISDLRFLVLSSGPMGKSQLMVEGSVNGDDWTPVGPPIELTEYDSEGQEVVWTDYMRNRGYTQLRFRLAHGGRNCRLKFLTIEYTDGFVYEDLAAGSVSQGTQMTINEKAQGEFREGTYLLTVAAGDDWYFYDESDIARYDFRSAGIDTIVNDSPIDTFHDLMGRKVSSRFKGIVVRNSGREAIKTIKQ